MTPFDDLVIWYNSGIRKARKVFMFKLKSGIANGGELPGSARSSTLLNRGRFYSPPSPPSNNTL